jgi:hypothetical protein
MKNLYFNSNNRGSLLSQFYTVFTAGLYPERQMAGARPAKGKAGRELRHTRIMKA